MRNTIQSNSELLRRMKIMLVYLNVDSKKSIKKSVPIDLYFFELLNFGRCQKLDRVKTPCSSRSSVRACEIFILFLFTSFSPFLRRGSKVLLENKCAVSHYVRSRTLFRHVLRTFSATFTVAIMNNHERRSSLLFVLYTRLRNRSNCFHDIT